MDRGPDTIAIYNLFDKLRKQANAAGGLVNNRKIHGTQNIPSCKPFSLFGGRGGNQNSTFLFYPSLLYIQVVNVYGNHEVMNLGGDLRYVTEEDYTSFGGRLKRKEAWDVKTGWLGKQIYSNFNITYKSAHTVFSHGDLEPEWARLGVDTLNYMAREAIWNGQFRAPIFQGDGGLEMRRLVIICVAIDLDNHSLCLVVYFPPHEIGPIWSRGHATEEGGEAATCKRIEAVKKALGVRTFGSTHTEIGFVICSSCSTDTILFFFFFRRSTD